MTKKLLMILIATGALVAACGTPTGKVYGVYDYTSCRAQGGAIANTTPPKCKTGGKIYTAQITRAN